MMMKTGKKNILLLLLFGLFACEKSETIIGENQEFEIKNGNIFQNGNVFHAVGANAFHSFGGNSNDMNSWHLNIVREFVSNVKENPVLGSAIQAQNGAYLHALQKIVDNNRSNNKITILCVFGWDGNATTECTGKSPQQCFWYNDLKLKLKIWAAHFKNQPDVWLEVWNEPYRFDRADGYTDDVWASDMNDLVSVIRNAENQNIILVPCAEQGQDESVLINRANDFLIGKKNILFDIHAYEKWLLGSNSNISSRLANLAAKKIPVFFGEVAPMNAGVLLNPSFFLNEIFNTKLGVCAWVWKYDGQDTNALLDNAGFPNYNNNNNWGSMFKNYAGRTRN